MRLSEAIRLGAALYPQAFDHYTEVLETPPVTWQGHVLIDGFTELRVCAIAGAGFAIGLGDQIRNWENTDADGDITTLLPREWRDLLHQESPCCACECENPGTVESAIEHLNDEHGWTRERIAGWVESIELSMPAFADPQLLPRGLCRTTPFLRCTSGLSPRFGSAELVTPSTVFRRTRAAEHLEGVRLRMPGDLL
jgi:hypothetical protein